MYELLSDSNDSNNKIIGDLGRPFTPHNLPKEITLKRRIQEVIKELDSELDDDPFAPFTRAPSCCLQGIQRQNDN